MSIPYWIEYHGNRPNSTTSTVAPGDAVKNLLATWADDPDAKHLCLRVSGDKVARFSRKSVH